MKNENEDVKTTRIDRCLYDISYEVDPTGEKCVTLTPRTSGSIARSGNVATYSYSHGGDTYRKAVDKANEILREMQ